MFVTDVIVEDIGEGSDTCSGAAAAPSGMYTRQSFSPLMAHRAHGVAATEAHLDESVPLVRPPDEGCIRALGSLGLGEPDVEVGLREAGELDRQYQRLIIGLFVCFLNGSGNSTPVIHLKAVFLGPSPNLGCVRVGRGAYGSTPTPRAGSGDVATYSTGPLGAQVGVQNLQQTIVALRGEVNLYPSPVDEDGVGTDLFGFFTCEIVRISDYFSLSHALIVGLGPAPALFTQNRGGPRAQLRQNGGVEPWFALSWLP